jgi:hypothetical protein
MRVKAGVKFHRVPEDELRTEDIYDFVDGDEPPAYTPKDEDAPPRYDELYGPLVRTVRNPTVMNGGMTANAELDDVVKPNRKRGLSTLPALQPKATRVLRSCARKNAQI